MAKQQSTISFDGGVEVSNAPLETRVYNNYTGITNLTPINLILLRKI